MDHDAGDITEVKIGFDGFVETGENDNVVVQNQEPMIGINRYISVSYQNYIRLVLCLNN